MPLRPELAELRLTAFKSYRDAVLPLGPVTLLHGAPGAGKSNALEALVVLAALAEGEEAGAALAGVRGGAAGCAPFGEELIRLGCSVDGPQGVVRLDVTVCATGAEVVVAAERLAVDGRLLVTTGAVDPIAGRIDVAWHSDGRQGDIRAPLSAAGLVTAQLPLRVAGATAGERLVLGAAEQVLTALRETFGLDPAPARMRDWVRAADDARLRGTAENLSAVIARIEGECRIRFGRLVQAACGMGAVPVTGLGALRRSAPDGAVHVCAALDEPGGRRVAAETLPSGVLRQLAFATALLTGPGVLQMSPAAEIPDAERLLQILADGLDLGLPPDRTAALLQLATEVAARGHVRLLATAGAVVDVPGVRTVLCCRDARGHSALLPG
ncbi:ATP-binding protein [Streptacidiphilus pinicola]|uniref:ATP-binding protein n=1 Tax=Streptacidiphilus pinicola TaxID=2219663 RepID=A0A2X0KF13_9ACTN|nr:ATP-binding protein [Streptacidiphilus pinicola]RAG87625.1 ATP-binding protein [Streptacidiphilus pinicola]